MGQKSKILILSLDAKKVEIQHLFLLYVVFSSILSRFGQGHNLTISQDVSFFVHFSFPILWNIYFLFKTNYSGGARVAQWVRYLPSPWVLRSGPTSLHGVPWLGEESASPSPSAYPPAPAHLWNKSLKIYLKINTPLHCNIKIF